MHPHSWRNVPCSNNTKLLRFCGFPMESPTLHAFLQFANPLQNDTYCHTRSLMMNKAIKVDLIFRRRLVLSLLQYCNNKGISK